MDHLKTKEQLSLEKRVDVWMHHNSLRWNAILSTPIFSGTILLGWYSLDKEGQEPVANAVLVAGAVGMLAILLLARRLSQFAGAYYDSIEVKPKIAPPFCKISGDLLASLIPILLSGVFLALLFVDTKAASSIHDSEPESIALPEACLGDV